MSRDAGAERFRREMSAGLPTGPYRMSEQAPTITAPKTTRKAANYMIAGGIVMIDDGSGWRPATASEIEEITGGVTC